MKKKFLLTSILAASMLLMAGCGGGGSTIVDEPGEAKPLTGIDACFNEDLGYYNESPSVIRQGATQYMFYTRNEVKSDNTTDTIAVRKATFSNGK